MPCNLCGNDYYGVTNQPNKSTSSLFELLDVHQQMSSLQSPLHLHYLHDHYYPFMFSLRDGTLIITLIISKHASFLFFSFFIY